MYIPASFKIEELQELHDVVRAAPLPNLVVSNDAGLVATPLPLLLDESEGEFNPTVYEYLEAERIKYVIRLPANRVLQEKIGHLLTRHVGRPPNEVRRSYANFTYQAGSWSKRAGSSPKSSGIRANSIRASASS